MGQLLQIEPLARASARARPGAMMSGVVYAPVRAEQDRIRRSHQAAQVRRLARLRARRRCEDLAELLGQMALRPRDPDQTADLLRRSLVAAREIERLVTGVRGARPRSWQPQEITPRTLNCLEQIVDELDDAIRDALSRPRLVTWRRAASPPSWQPPSPVESRGSSPHGCGGDPPPAFAAP